MFTQRGICNLDVFSAVLVFSHFVIDISERQRNLVVLNNNGTF